MEKSMIIEDERGKSYVLTISIREVSDALQGQLEDDKSQEETIWDEKPCCHDTASINITATATHTHATFCMTFAELADEYLQVYAHDRLKPGTVQTYKTAIDRYLLPAFGTMRLSDISPQVISENLSRAHFPKQDKPLSHARLKMLSYCLRSIMKYAVKKQYIAENPCRNMLIPERKQPRDSRKKYLEDRELRSFLRLFANYTQYNAAIKLLLYTGLRSGELLGLKWKDIDFRNHLIRVERSLTNIPGAFILTSPKSEAGRRTICMNKSIETLLREHKRNITGRKAMGEELVFTNKRGGYLTRQTLNREFHRATAGTPFAAMSLHCLRHSNATILINNGLDLKLVAEHLGHSKISTTADIYANVTDEGRRMVAAVLEKKLSRIQKAE